MANYDYSKFLNLCMNAGKTPSAVATEAGVSKSLISRWKNGGGLSDVTAMKICDFFDILLFDLAEDGGAMSAASVKNSIVLQGNHGNCTVSNGGHPDKLSEQEQEVLRIFRSLDMRKKTAVLSYLYDMEDSGK